MHSSVKRNFKETVEKWYEHPGLKVHSGLLIWQYFKHENIRIHKILHYVFETQVYMLKNLLLLGGPWDMGIAIWALIRTPHAQLQTFFSVFTPSLVWLIFSVKTLKSLISHPDLASNSKLYTQLPTWHFHLDDWKTFSTILLPPPPTCSPITVNETSTHLGA